MALEKKYNNVDSNSGERIATNGNYTGHQVGTPLQDASPGADNAAYVKERNTKRVGTLLPDAADSAFPTTVEELSS